MFDWLPATLARHGQTRERELGRGPLGALRQTVNKGVDRCVSLTTSTSTWQWACVPSRVGESPRFSPVLQCLMCKKRMVRDLH